MEKDPGHDSPKKFLKRILGNMATEVRPARTSLETTEQTGMHIHMATEGVIASLLEREVVEAEAINDRLKLLQKESQSMVIDLWDVAESFEKDQFATNDPEVWRENKTLAATSAVASAIAVLQAVRHMDKTEVETIDTSRLIKSCEYSFEVERPDISPETFLKLLEVFELAKEASGPEDRSS